MSHLKANSAARLSAPSPTPSNSSTGAPKRKRPAEDGPRSVVYSQPADTGSGRFLHTQLTYTVDFLKLDSSKWHTAKEIFDYLNVPVQDEEDRARVHSQLESIYRRDVTTFIDYNPKNQTYRYHPKLNIRNADDMRRYLQTQKSAQGLSVKDIKDGWPSALQGIAELEAKKEILVAHHKKDGSPKTVWINDPSLMHDMDATFRENWLRTPLPANPDDLRAKLIVAGLKPSSVARDSGPAKPKEKKRKAPRHGGKQTNTHMAAILKDFSHMRK